MDGKYTLVGLNSFYGGMSIDKQLGRKSQFYYSKHFDFRKNPSQLSVLPQGTKTDGGVVDDLVLDMTQINSGERYAAGDAGHIYKITTAGVWSSKGQLGENGGGGIIYRADVDHVYITGTNKVARISRMTSSKLYEQNWFARGISSSTTCYKASGANTYTLQTSIAETASGRRSFTSDIEPIYQIGIKVIAKGTGDWTLTLHDDANNSLGSVTITTANLNSNQINYFVFASPIRIQRGNSGAGSALTYHFHVTSTMADGTLATTTASSLADCDMELWANALVSTQNGLHPMINFLNLTLIGNGRYVASYEPLQDSPTTSDFSRHKLTLPPGYEVCGFAQKNLFAIVGAEKRSSSGEFQEGALFFWDGISDSYNDWYQVPEGAPESLFSEKNIARYTAGGALYRIVGTDSVVKERTFRNTDSELSSVSDITHAPLHGMCVRRGILLIGYPYSTTNQSLEHGVYSLGSINSEFPPSFGFSYNTSNDSILNNGSNNLRLGMVKSYGDTLYMSWRDDEESPHHYGVDIINNSSSPASSATIELLQIDDNRPYAHKQAGYIVGTFNELPASTSVTVKYKIDGEANWHSSEAVTSGKQIVMPIDLRFYNIDVALDAAVNGTTPYITGLYVAVDPLKHERPSNG